MGLVKFSAPNFLYDSSDSFQIVEQKIGRGRTSAGKA